MTIASSSSTDTADPVAEGGLRVGLLHGAGYVGGELIRLLIDHPDVALTTITSRTFAGDPVTEAHPSLRGQTDRTFTVPSEAPISELDAVLVAGEHGQSMHLIPELLDAGVDGPIVDLSADFRFRDPSVYPKWFDVEHPAPELLESATYGLPELASGAPSGPIIANPGCYATALSLALAPLVAQEPSLTAHVTALTGASGSGATPSAATHFPTRDGNVRPYKVLAHQHTPEVRQTLGPSLDLQFVPASGPWTRGIWGTAQVEWPSAPAPEAVAGWFEAAYADAPFVRTSAGTLPSLQPTVGTPFCDVGWQVDGPTLVVGFALDNLLKGAASQAVQNLNRVLGLSETAGLLPKSATKTT